MKKVILISGLVLLVLTTGALGLWFIGRPVYRHHKETCAVEQAQAFLAQNQYREASLNARQALLLNPSNAEACRVMAQLAELCRDPQALNWWRRVAELAPTAENKLRFAFIALQLQGPPYPLTAQMLEELAPAANTNVSYHVLAAQLALKLNQSQQAQFHLEEATRLEPTNSLHQFNLAVLQLRSTNETTATTARATLERLCSNTNLSTAALRWLVDDRRARKDLAAAERFSRQLLADPQVTLDDRLQHLTLLRQAQAPEFDSFLKDLKAGAATNAAAMHAVGSWMIGNGLASQAMQWLTNAPASMRDQQPVPLAIADGYIAAKSWVALQLFLESQKWGESEFLRLALLSRAADEQQQSLAADVNWRQAVVQAEGQLGRYIALLSLAGNWGRTEAQEALLWQITQKFPRERWAFGELERRYQTAGNTPGLNRLYTAMLSALPADPVAKNNFAAISLLLKLNLSRAYGAAREVYNQHPDVPNIAATYAYSLHLQGRTKEGLAVLEKLKAEALAQPDVALYYGVLLGADGQSAKAGQYLALTQKASLLPEEKSLAAQALSHS